MVSAPSAIEAQTLKMLGKGEKHGYIGWKNQENGRKITRYYHEKRAVFRNKLGHLVVFVVYGQGRNTN